MHIANDICLNSLLTLIILGDKLFRNEEQIWDYLIENKSKVYQIKM